MEYEKSSTSQSGGKCACARRYLAKRLWNVRYDTTLCVSRVARALRKILMDSITTSRISCKSLGMSSRTETKTSTRLENRACKASIKITDASMRCRDMALAAGTLVRTCDGAVKMLDTCRAVT